MNVVKNSIIVVIALTFVAKTNSQTETSEQTLESFAENIKTVEIAQDSRDDIERKVGAPWSKTDFGGRETWQYVFGPAMAWVQFDTSGKVIAVRVAKIGGAGGMSMVDVFTKGKLVFAGDGAGDQESSARFFEGLVEPPPSPIEGEVYFNTSDKRFYGWNGTSWVILGGNP
ncbi:MAG: hypothetical protein RIQ71_1625 [Verrucomicrobiota bacterium]|jgi:hypothetical protein